jgi:peptidoglycan/LPS O-acetylase OafA/YrhL
MSARGVPAQTRGMRESEVRPIVAATRPADRRRVVKRVAALLSVVVLSLAVVSVLHLTGGVSGRGPSYGANSAGIAEAVIGVVLATAVAALWRAGWTVVRWALWGVGFAVVGFCFGLSFTAQGGHWPDIAYHLTVLPLLVASLVVLLRTGARHGQPPA